MPRYLPKFTRRRSALDAEFQRELEQLRNQILRELQSESQRLLKQMQQELAQSLHAQLVAAGSGNVESTASPLGGFSRVVGSALRLFSQRPTRSVSRAETQRSITEQQKFRLSRNQHMAELSVMLGKGEVNL